MSLVLEPVSVPRPHPRQQKTKWSNLAVGAAVNLFQVTSLGQPRIIGLPWFQKHNPDVDWTNQCLYWRNEFKDHSDLNELLSTMTYDGSEINQI